MDVVEVFVASVIGLRGRARPTRLPQEEATRESARARELRRDAVWLANSTPCFTAHCRVRAAEHTRCSEESDRDIV